MGIHWLNKSYDVLFLIINGNFTFFLLNAQFKYQFWKDVQNSAFSKIKVKMFLFSMLYS